MSRWCFLAGIRVCLSADVSPHIPPTLIWARVMLITRCAKETVNSFSAWVSVSFGIKNFRKLRSLCAWPENCIDFNYIAWIMNKSIKIIVTCLLLFYCFKRLLVIIISIRIIFARSFEYYLTFHPSIIFGSDPYISISFIIRITLCLKVSFCVAMDLEHFCLLKKVMPQFVQ